MDYLTNYYKNLCEQLQAKANFLERYLIEELESSEEMATMGDKTAPSKKPTPPPSEKPTETPKEAPKQKPGTGFPKPGDKNYNPVREKDPKGTPHPAKPGSHPKVNPHPYGSEKWKRWFYLPGNWSYENPYPYGSDEWFKWESDPED